MIVDSHVYCFEPGNHPAGFENAEAHLRWIQEAQGVHHQPAWRVRDRAPASSEGLTPTDYASWSGFPDVDFRIDEETGRVVWTIDGEDYTKQFYPPNLRHLEFTPHSLVAEMDYAGVDVALIHTNPMLSRDADFIAGCVSAYPRRLRAMAPVDEWLLHSEMDSVIETLHRSITELGLHAIKFNARPFYFGSSGPWDAEPYTPFWDVVASLNVPVFFTLGSGRNDVRRNLSPQEAVQGYLDEQKVLVRWMDRYPGVTVNLTHGFPWRAFVVDDGISEMPQDIWLPFENPNCYLEVCFPVRIGDIFDFPYREAQPVLQALVEHVGTGHLNWGTDMPFQNRFCTYRQSRAWIEGYCQFLCDEDLRMILGGTAARILGLKPPAG